VRGILGLLFLIIIVAWFVGRSGPTTPPTTRLPALSPTEALDQGKKIFDTWRDPKFKSDVELAAVDRVIANLQRVPTSDALHETAQKAADALRPIQQNLAKQAEERARREKEKKAAEEAQWVREVLAVRQLRSSMHNPNSFTIESALRMNDGTLCLTYRAANAFNALRLGRAVIDAKRIATSDDPDRFSGAWNHLCANKTGTDIKYIRLAI
jgi:hypothetical protein